MAKTTIRDSVINQAMAQSLKEAGIQDRAALDKLMSTTSIEKILSDAPAVYNYFKLANLSLESMVYPRDQREVRGAIPTPDHYREYFDNQNPQPTPYFNFIPAQEMFNPDVLGQKAGFTTDQTNAYRNLVQPPAGPEEAAPTWSDVSGQGQAGGYGGGAGKAMSMGGNYGGNTKSMNMGGNPQSKSLGAPPPPPGMGGPGGGYVPPPPGSGGTGGTGGSPDSTGEFNYGMGSQAGRDYVDQNLANDPSYGWFQQLFGRTDMTQNIMTGLMDEQARDDQLKNKIMTELQTLDPSTPEGSRRLTALNYEMQEINNTRSERMDKLMTCKRFQDELVTMVKGMIDIQFRTTDAISKNMRQ